MNKINNCNLAMYNKHIVICGSMSNYEKMIKCQQYLEDNDIPSIVPRKEKVDISKLSIIEYNNFKRKVSSHHFKKIREKNVFGILVVNDDNNGIPNYIGANTFAEIAMAFCWNRKIFLLNCIYGDYKDELLAWGAITLESDISRIVKIYLREEQNSLKQLKLSDIF